MPGDNKPSGIQDTCGDIDANHNPLFPSITLTVACIDPDQDGKLNLPNCTSWRQKGANDLCTSPAGAFPGSPSKCRCDIGFNVDIDVPPAELLVTKTADPIAVNEPGGSVDFTVSITNTGIDPNNSVTISSLLDSIYGDITTTGHDGITATTCALSIVIPPDDGNPGGIDTYTCSFTANVLGNGGDVETDTITAAGFDQRNNPVSGSDDATVTINDVQPAISVIKTADPIEVNEPGGNVSFNVLVTNNSVSSDPVTINTLVDNIHGNLNGQGTCSVPQVIAGNGGTYSCSFTDVVAGNAGDIETDTVTASGADDEGNPVSASDSATVTVLNVPSAIELLKTANPISLAEPGGNVTYTFTVTNISTVDTVTINSLVDSILGDLNGRGTCSVPQVLVAGASYSCSLIEAVSGNAFDAITNTATATGVDDDGEPVMAADDATVNIENVPPAASLIKTATELLVTYSVTVCNDSDAEQLTLDALSDDIYGDITDVANPALTETTCVVPQDLAPADGDASDNDCYSCSFRASTTTSPTIDTVTGTVSDNDGSTPATPSDSATVTFE